MKRAGEDGISESQARRNVVAFIPLAIATVAAALVVVFEISRYEIQAGAFAPVLHGFFFDAFAPLLFLIVYGVARIVVVALAEPSELALARFVTAPLAVAALLAVSIYPSFGGMVARSAFVVGGLVFVEGLPIAVAFPFGVAVAAIPFSLVTGLGIIGVRLAFRRGWRFIGIAFRRYLAFVFAGLVLLSPAWSGVMLFGDWPAWPMTPTEGAALVLATIVALLPHTLIVRRFG